MTTPKILIVDDEPHLRLLLEQTLEDLEEEGVELLSAGNGEAALECIAEHRPRLVLLDLMMPKLSGFDVCDRVKRQWKYDDVHIIILTARSQEFDVKRGHEVGCDGYVTKPFSPLEVYKLARSVLELGPEP